MKVVDGNIFDSDADAILHQVNCQGVMGSGIAKLIKEKYPSVYSNYRMRCCLNKGSTSELLGVMQSCAISLDKYIVNLFAQDKYGRSKCYTDYDALRNCLRQVNEVFAGKTVAIPYMMSCVRGGGDWNIVFKIIEEELKDCDVTLYRFSG